MEKIIKPSGSEIYPIESVKDPEYYPSKEVLRTPEGDWFDLTNRSFEEINETFANLPSLVIEKLKRSGGQNRVIKILDIGAGVEARAAEDIAKKRDEYISVFSLDLVTRPQKGKRANQIVGDASHLSLKDASIDMAYSRMSVSQLDQTNLKKEKLLQVLSEVARALKPGGVFFVDEHFIFASGIRLFPLNREVKQLKRLGEEGEVSFYLKEFLTTKRLKRFVKKLVSRESHKFLIMIKKPLDKELLRVLAVKNRDLLTFRA